tara:strand:+ start:22073 stop:22384 length:312 start_codon:yes stop_codon:yes gene_type:complete
MQFFITGMKIMLWLLVLIGYALAECPEKDITPPHLRRTVHRQLSRISCDKTMPLLNTTVNSHRKFILSRNDLEITQAEKTTPFPPQKEGSRRKFTIKKEKKSQ